MSDPSGLRAGVERLIAEWEELAEREGEYRVAGWIAAQTKLLLCAQGLRALLAKHPPTPLELSDRLEIHAQELNARARIVRKSDPDVARVLDDEAVELRELLASPPSDPSPVEQEKS